MEIKKGISQMAEYPNVEVNYVIPENGSMYYVVEDGVLANGAVIATLDPKHAIDEANECETVGLFSEAGDILIDFDKKNIKKINDDLVLVVESVPETNEVIDAISKKDDEISKVAIEENKKIILDKLTEKMGANGEIIFQDPYSEANVYTVDSYNNKVGINASYIGKNESGLYFNTNDVDFDTKFVAFDNQVNFDENKTEEVESNDEEVVNPELSNDAFTNFGDFDLNDSSGVLGGFGLTGELDKISSEQVADEINASNQDEVEDNAEQEAEEEVEEDEEVEETREYKSSSDDEVYENAKEIISKLIEETNRLTKKVEELEAKVSKQDEIISDEEKKKDELNDLLGKANEVLENIK